LPCLALLHCVSIHLSYQLLVTDRSSRPLKTTTHLGTAERLAELMTGALPRALDARTVDRCKALAVLYVGGDGIGSVVDG